MGLIFPALACGLLALLGGIWSGALRLALPLPGVGPQLPQLHGVLMVPGFLATVIAIERAAALRTIWAWATPAAQAAAILLLTAGWSLNSSLVLAIGSWLLVPAAGLQVGVALAIVRRQPALFTREMALGAVALLLGNLTWLLGESIPLAIPGWVVYLLLTISGERLELNRLMRPGRSSRTWHISAICLLCLAPLLQPVSQVIGTRMLGAGVLVLASWLLTHDLARRTWRLGGLPRYTATCLLAGYVWLVPAGVLFVTRPGMLAGPWYDAAVHCVLAGFVMSMILGHAPIILPALTGRSIHSYRPLYALLVLLQSGMAVRLAGDLLLWEGCRQAGGILQLAAILGLPPLVVLLSARLGTAPAGS